MEVVHWWLQRTLVMPQWFTSYDCIMRRLIYKTRCVLYCLSIQRGTNLRFQTDFNKLLMIQQRGYTALMFGALSRNITVINALLFHNATVDLQNNVSTIFRRIKVHTNVPVSFHCFMSTPALLNLVQGGYTALMWASDSGHETVVDLLLQHGANVDLQNKVSSLARFMMMYTHEVLGDKGGMLCVDVGIRGWPCGCSRKVASKERTGGSAKHSEYPASSIVFVMSFVLFRSIGNVSYLYFGYRWYTFVM